MGLHKPNLFVFLDRQGCLSYHSNNSGSKQIKVSMKYRSFYRCSWCLFKKNFLSCATGALCLINLITLIALVNRLLFYGIQVDVGVKSIREFYIYFVCLLWSDPRFQLLLNFQ